MSYINILLVSKKSFISGRFDEDGSFIGQYVTVTKTKHRVSNELTAAVAAEASGATYV